jgi:hypothetical protein
VVTNAAVQELLNRLTESARADNKKQEAEDPATVLSNLKGHVSVKNGIATLSDVLFSAPGTLAQIRGTYNLLDKTVNLQGVLHTNGKLSNTTSGFKALVLKAVRSVPEEENGNGSAIHDQWQVCAAIIRIRFRWKTDVLTASYGCQATFRSRRRAGSQDI